MFDQVTKEPILDALCRHVALEADVSDALTALYTRQPSRVADLLTEARELASELDPSAAHAGPAFDLDGWLRRLLHGPHDRDWFHSRVRSGRQGWASVSPMASAVLIGRVRHRLTEMAGIWDGSTGFRVVDAVGRLFDLEMAIIILDAGLTRPPASRTGATASIASVTQEGTLAISNALAVIQTSAYLVGRYSEQASPSRPDIQRHLDRIAEHVDRAKAQVGVILQAVAKGGSLLH